MPNLNKVESWEIKQLDKEKPDLEEMAQEAAELLASLVNNLNPKSETEPGKILRKKSDQPELVKAKEFETPEHEAAILLELPAEGETTQKIAAVLQIVASEKEAEFKVHETASRLLTPGKDVFERLASGERVFRLDIYLPLSNIRGLIKNYFVDLSKLEDPNRNEYVDLRQKFIQELIDQLGVLADPRNKADILATKKINERQLVALNSIRSKLRKIIE